MANATHAPGALTKAEESKRETRVRYVGFHGLVEGRAVGNITRGD